MSEYRKMVELKICPACGKLIERKQNETPHKYARRRFCNRKCFMDSSRIEVRCAFCGKDIIKKKCLIKGFAKSFCNKKCESMFGNLGENTELKGSYVCTKGYDNRKVNGKYVGLHRIVMSRHLGRPLLKSEIVHHMNGNRRDNRLENLCIVSNSTHEHGTYIRFLQKRIVELEERLTNEAHGRTV